MYNLYRLMHFTLYFPVWMSLKPFAVRKLSENDRNYFLRSSRQNETMFVSDIGMAYNDFGGSQILFLKKPKSSNLKKILWPFCSQSKIIPTDKFSLVKISEKKLLRSFMYLKQKAH